MSGLFFRPLERFFLAILLAGRSNMWLATLEHSYSSAIRAHTTSIFFPIPRSEVFSFHQNPFSSVWSRNNQKWCNENCIISSFEFKLFSSIRISNSFQDGLVFSFGRYKIAVVFTPWNLVQVLRERFVYYDKLIKQLMQAFVHGFSLPSTTQSFSMLVLYCHCYVSFSVDT